MHGPLVTLLLVGGYTLLGCAAFELGYRAQTERRVFVLDNWRAERIDYRTFGDRATFDPVLGWVSKEWYEGDGYNTLDHGIRRNFEEHEVRTGAVLAVGGSLADGGPDVDDEETWPAQLEGMAGMPVLNAGVEGYATDQIVLRAEQLLPAVKPKTLILGLAAQDITRVGYASFGAPKPHFTLDKDELTYHAPDPVAVHDRAEPAWRIRAREILGYSAVLDVVFSHLAPDYWRGKAGQQVFQKVETDPVGVTCALLGRLKQRADPDGVRLLLFMQHGFQAVADKDAPGDEAKRVAACATAMSIEVVDEFASLRGIAVASRDALRDLYLEDDDGHRPMSPKGNRHAAELLAGALGKQR
jgi:hypothetical protein